jgi:HK97 family phage major capsid protein
MVKLHELKETRAGKVAEMRQIVAGAESAGRDLNEVEAARFAELRTDSEAIEQRIARAEFLAEAERRTTATPVSGDLAREVRSYSLAKAVSEFTAGRLTGREAEIQSEYSRSKEFRGLAIPSSILLGSGAEKRGQTVGDDTAGGFLAPVNLAPVQDRFRVAMRVEQLGATVLRDLSGAAALDLPNLYTSGSTYWIGEDVDTTPTAAAFDKITLAPRTVSAQYRISRKLMLQSAQSVENILRDDLSLILASEIDRVAIAGSGVGSQPLGIINTPNVTPITTTQNVWNHANDLIATLEAANAPERSRAFLMNSVVAKMARTLMDGDGLPLGWPVVFSGNTAVVSNNVPANIDGSKSALIFGEWSQLYIGLWSAIDILPNPYADSVASSGAILLTAFADLDVAVRNPAGFAFSKI